MPEMRAPYLLQKLSNGDATVDRSLSGAGGIVTQSRTFREHFRESATVSFDFEHQIAAKLSSLRCTRVRNAFANLYLLFARDMGCKRLPPHQSASTLLTRSQSKKKSG